MNPSYDAQWKLAVEAVFYWARERSTTSRPLIGSWAVQQSRASRPHVTVRSRASSWLQLNSESPFLISDTVQEKYAFILSLTV